MQPGEVDPVVGVGVAEDHRVELGQIEVALEVGQAPGTEVDGDVGAAVADEVAAARAVLGAG